MTELADNAERQKEVYLTPPQVFSKIKHRCQQSGATHKHRVAKGTIADGKYDGHDKFLA